MEIAEFREKLHMCLSKPESWNEDEAFWLEVAEMFDAVVERRIERMEEKDGR